MARSPLDRFVQKYVKAESGCWTWIGARKPGGYGNFLLAGAYESAHRASWLLHRGEIPDGQWVLHRCDNPRCVNPEHLFLGAPVDNTHDMVSKGRQRFARRKVSDDQVLEIRAARADGAQLKELARRFGVSESLVSLIARGKTRAAA